MLDRRTFVAMTGGALLGFAPNLRPRPVVVKPPISGSGIAQTVAKEADLASHLSVLTYDNPISGEYIKANFENLPAARPTVDLDTEIIDLPQYGLKAVRVKTSPVPQFQNERLISWHHYFEPQYPAGDARRRPWRREYGSGYTHLFLRYLIRVGADVRLGMTADGSKLPGLAGTYGDSNTGIVTLPAPNPFHTWEMRLWHGRPEIVNGVARYHLALYPYLVGWPLADGTYWQDTIAMQYNLGPPPQIPFPFTSGYLIEETWHCVELEMQMNTMAANNVTAANACPFDGSATQAQKDAAVAEAMANASPDGVIRVRLDDAVIFESKKMKIRGHDKVRIQNAWMNIYHGGVGKFPAVPFHYDLSGICVATERVGMPRIIA